jgi:hypothetical protein
MDDGPLTFQLARLEDPSRFFMFEFDAGIDRDPITATRDFFSDKLNAKGLEPRKNMLPEGVVRTISQRIHAYGERQLTEDELADISEALNCADKVTLKTAKNLVRMHIKQTQEMSPRLVRLLEVLLDHPFSMKRRGRVRAHNENRNFVIHKAVKRLTAAGLSKIGTELSACEIVSGELCRLGYPLTADAVRKIVDSYLPSRSHEEELTLTRAEMMKGVSEETLETVRQWRREMYELGKKMGYIPSSE